jgi:diacylglycerol diphosphate phosphatase/phosphatidate phosphatase
MMIGLVLGILAYRSAYAAVFDFRYNHIPLPPFVTKDQYALYADRHQDTRATLEGDHAVQDEPYWSWWKQHEANNEEKEEEMAWLRSIRSTRVTGREQESKNETRMRKLCQESLQLRAQADEQMATNVSTTTSA